MRKFKKLMTLLLCASTLSASAGMFSACGGGGSGEISVMMLVNDGSDIWYEEKFEALEQELGVTIDYVGYAFQDYDNQLRLAMQDRVPDVFYIRPNQIKNFVADGLLADLTGYIAENVDSSALLDNFNDAFRYDGTDVGGSEGQIYAVNGGYSYQGLAYNKILIDGCREAIHDVGLSAPDELQEGETYTWDEFALLLDTINGMPVGGANGEDPIGAMDMPTGNMLLQMMMNFGANILDTSTGTVNIDTPQVQACLDYLVEAQNDRGSNGIGYISSDNTFTQWKGNLLAFYTASGSWEMEKYGEYEEIESGILQDVNVDFMPWPTETGNYADTRALVGGAGYAVYSGSENLELAMQVATYFMTPDILDEMCYEGMVLPMTKELAEGAYLTDDKFHPDNKQFLLDVISGEVGEVSPLNNCYSVEWYDNFANNIDAVWNGSTSAADYIKEVAPRMQELYDMYNKNVR